MTCFHLQYSLIKTSCVFSPSIHCLCPGVSMHFLSLSCPLAGGLITVCDGVEAPVVVPAYSSRARLAGGFALTTCLAWLSSMSLPPSILMFSERLCAMTPHKVLPIVPTWTRCLCLFLPASLSEAGASLGPGPTLELLLWPTGTFEIINLLSILLRSHRWNRPADLTCS